MSDALISDVIEERFEGQLAKCNAGQTIEEWTFFIVFGMPQRFAGGGVKKYVHADRLGGDNLNTSPLFCHEFGTTIAV